MKVKQRVHGGVRQGAACLDSLFGASGEEENEW